ncbi:MAG: lasso peptide biosynthesis B2 protein, partial [Pseudomonadota bacterium]
MKYSFLYLACFLSTKFLGLDRTLRFFRWLGRSLQKLGTFQEKPDTLEQKLKASLEKVPVAAKCLDQAVVTWYLLNLHGHPASLKIGLSLTPLESHAWVVLGSRIFVDTYNIADLTPVAEYGPWV